MLTCPNCNAEIFEEYIFCGNCGVNINDYKKSEELIKRAKEFEQRFEYASAEQEYRKALKLQIPKDKVHRLLNELTLKQSKILDNISKGKEHMEEKRYKSAILFFKKALTVNPNDENAKVLLIQAQKMIRKIKHKQRIITAIFIIIIGGILGWHFYYTHTPRYIAKKTLKIGLKAQDVVARRIAVKALGEVGDVRFIPLLREALKDDDIITRKNAAESLGKIAHPSTIPLLRKALFDKNSLVRAAAAEALALKGDLTGKNFLKNVLKE